VPPPAPDERVIAVASYFGGVILHDARTFKLIGIIPTPGAPGDVTLGPGGSIYAPMTGGDALLGVRRDPWTLTLTPGVPVGNEVIAARDGSVYVSNRDVNGKGAVTRISGGTVQRVETGVTAEGLALDESAHRLYVGNVNDDTVTELDTRSFSILRRIHAVPRVFGIALDAAHGRLFVVSNQNSLMRKTGGYVATIDLRSGKIVARSADLPFPIGAAYDPGTAQLFVTDEDTGNVYALDAATLASRRAPLHVCDVPWRPHVEAARHLLYVPCTRANEIVVVDTRTMRQAAGSPFATGRYPLGVATP
jgi:DNA-binding beta-propeller fold protein YncE